MEQVVIFKKDVREKYDAIYAAEAEQVQQSLNNIKNP